MASSSQTVSSADWTESLPDVHLEVRQGSARASTFTLDSASFLIGSVPGCDLRVGAAEAPAVLCLLTRHAGGVALRKLAPTQGILVNGRSASHRELANGDRLQIGILDIQVHIGPVRIRTAPSADQEKAQLAFQNQVQQFREQVVRFQQEKDAFERERTQSATADWETQRADLSKELQQRDEMLAACAAEIERQKKDLARAQPTAPSDWETQREEFLKQLRQRENLLEERGAEVERQKRELAKVRQEMDDLRRQLYEHYQDRRDRLNALQEELEKNNIDLQEREKKLRLQEQDAAERRQRDARRQEDLDKRSADFTQRLLQIEAERNKLEERIQTTQSDGAANAAEVKARQAAVDASAAELAKWNAELEGKTKQYEAEVLRLNRLQGEIERRELDLHEKTVELARNREQMQHDTAELETQFLQLDELRVQLTDEGERLALKKQEQDSFGKQLSERSASLEGQQATLAALRSRLERMREEIRAREKQLDEQHARQEARETELTRKHDQTRKLQSDLETDQHQYASDRQQWLERSAVMDSAVRQLKQAQDNLSIEEQRLRRESQELDQQREKFLESEGVLQGRLSQLGQTQERLELERQALRDRSANLVQREQACEALQEQLRRRADEIAGRHQESTNRLQEYQAKFNDIEEKRRQLDEREQKMNHQLETSYRDLEQKAETLQKQHAEVVGFEDKYRDQMNQLAVQRKTNAEDRAQFHLEQQAALEKLALARGEFETMRHEAQTLLEQLPDAELRAGNALDRLGNAREQLRSHLAEIHQYVRQCQDELEQLRGRLQADLDKLQQQEQTLRRSQDEHRLAMVAFRQQLIEWTGQIAELKLLLARDETRLERKQTQVDERAREMEAEAERLAKHAEDLDEQQRAVADRRQEIDGHLVDMREWYRGKLRELAGIALVPDTLAAASAEAATSPAVAEIGEDGEPGIVPIGRSILSITGTIDQGDQKLGEVLRELQLIDAATLTALLAEARRQRRSLRQVLLASGVITLYQLALIEAGNVAGLMLGPVRVIDRVRSTAHETAYRVFDPRRGAEAVLRHLHEIDMTDAVRPDEFRQRFAQARLNDPHVANTLEVLELLGRPAALQEWLTGLPATDWPPLAAAPGVCYRLLTQAAQGLSAAHQAGVVHGHLSDAHLLLTGDGVLKICGFGEPPWLVGAQPDEEPTSRDDLRTLGKIVSGWCTPTGVRKGPKTKPLPDALVSVLYRLAAEGEAGYRDVRELLEDLEKAGAAIPPNAEAWDRLLKYVREHGAAEALLRQSA